MKKNCDDCCYPPMTDPEACGCCEGVEIVTPLSTYNRPGLSEISYRIGTHSSFMETMIARLTTVKGLTTRNRNDPALALLDAWATVADVLTFYQERIANEGYLRTATERRSVQELAKLVGYRPRPGVASSVFLAYTLDDNHKEETVIPTGSRVQSIPGPDDLPQTFETKEALKARAQWNNLQPRMTRPQTEQSIRNNEIPRSAENVTDNNDNPTPSDNVLRVYLKGINTNLKVNDPLLIAIGIGDDRPKFSQVVEVIPDAAADHTLVKLQLSGKTHVGSETIATENGEELVSLANDKRFDDVALINDLNRPPSVQPPNALQKKDSLSEQFSPKSNTGFAVAGSFVPELQNTLTAAFGNANVTEPNPIKVFALRVKASLFGYNLPLPSCPVDKDTLDLSCCLSNLSGDPSSLNSNNPKLTTRSDLGLDLGEETDPRNMLALDAEYKEILPDTWVAIDDGTAVKILKVNSVDSTTLGGLLEEESKLSFFSTCPPITVSVIDTTTRSVQEGRLPTTGTGGDPPNTTTLGAERISWTTENSGTSISVGEAIKIKSTVLALDSPWREDGETNEILPSVEVYAQSEELELAEEPIETPVCGGVDDLIELDGFYEGLEAGRWVIVSGEREIGGTSGVRFSELAMLSSVTQDVAMESPQDTNNKNNGKNSPRHGEKIHSFIKLANELAYCFKRDTVTIYGNVVKATHGETRQEVLGSGDGSKALQTFELKQKPLTYVSASNPSGVDSTLQVFVNDIRWHEADSLAALQPNDRRFITKTDNEDKTSVIFGNGRKGARLPTGIENIKAEYRNGIGKQGNVKAEQISLLTTKPLGVKAVINPLRASGGGNRETRDQARKNVPLAVKALDRLVSVQDYEDFSRIYAGVGKAHAVELSNGRQQLVHVTIAGAEDIPIDPNADLFINLRKALQDFGDPHQAIKLDIRELMFIVIEAGVAILPDYQWEAVVTEIRKRLLDVFSFERRELGQDVVLSEVISVVQSVHGVAYVDVDTFGGIPEKITDDAYGTRRLLTPEEISEAVACLAARWSHMDMESFCSNNRNSITRENDECRQFINCQKYGHFDGTKGVRQRLQVNLAAVGQEGAIRPAQIAFLTPHVPATLILNQIK